MKPSILGIRELLRVQGQKQYDGEPVSQLDHALQCATLARDNGATSELIIACLLHDIGHLLHQLGEDIATKGIDDRHEQMGAYWLRSRFAHCQRQSLFSEAVTEPIRLHVEAKRYLCSNSAYLEKLSPASQHSLTLQGGVFPPQQAAEFISKPYAQEAIQLRIWDEQAKIKDLVTPNLDIFIDLLNTLSLQ